MRNILILMTVLLLSATSINAFTMFDQAVDVKYNNAEVTLGNLTILLYRVPTAGTPIFNRTFTNKIISGSWDIYFNISNLTDGETLYKDYRINNQNINFTNISGTSIDRLPFTVSFGERGNYTNYYNKTQINNNFSNYFTKNLYWLNATSSFYTKNQTYNKTFLDPYLVMGGSRVYWFTNQTNSAGTKNFSLSIPNGTLSELTTPIGATRVSLAQFITQKVTSQTVFVAGIRNIYVMARMTDANRVITLQARVYLCVNYNEITDTCQSKTSYANSSLSDNIGTTYSQYHMSYYVPNLYILNTTNRFIVNLTALKTSGLSTNVKIEVDDNSYSRIEVPSPVGVTDISGKLDITDQRYNETNKINSVNSSLINNYFTKTNYWLNATSSFFTKLAYWSNVTSSFYTKSQSDAKYLNSTENKYVYDINKKVKFNETKLNNTILNKLLATIYYVNTTQTVHGTSTTSNLSLLRYYDDKTWNISEASGTIPIDFRMNFTNVTTFNNIILREQYTGTSGHQIGIQLWDYPTSSWENYEIISDQTAQVVSSIPVLDVSNHISGNKVQARFYHITNTGNTGHRLYIDFFYLQNGLSSVSNQVDLSNYYNKNQINSQYRNITQDNTQDTAMNNSLKIYINNNLTKYRNKTLTDYNDTRLSSRINSLNSTKVSINNNITIQTNSPFIKLKDTSTGTESSLLYNTNYLDLNVGGNTQIRSSSTKTIIYYSGSATNDVVLISDGIGALKYSTISTTVLNYLSGVTSNIQTQLSAYKSSAGGWTNTSTTTTTSKIISTSKNITSTATKFCSNNTYAMICYGSD